MSPEGYKQAVSKGLVEIMSPEWTIKDESISEMAGETICMNETSVNYECLTITCTLSHVFILK